ncbi:hypothetical protein EG328_006877 [Venturia inaequalis]|uniref:Uncharacterized protein n=1 Tax=Venturia inaequalis TaxID=5025 RepID=A0A8H3YQH1_VENIN|nr:hypothetical protein EG328_006877 [Venturia inaequalis]
MIHIAKSILEIRPAIEIANTQTHNPFLKVYPVMEQERIQVSRCSHCDGTSVLKPGLLRAEEAQQQPATNDLANALDAFFGFDVNQNMALKKDSLILKKCLDIHRRDIYQLKGSQIFRHVGEHDDRLNEVDEELDDLKAILEKHSKRIQHYEDLENAKENMRTDDWKATLENHSKRIEQLECLEGAMEKMKIDEAKTDATDEVEWEHASFME